MAAEDRLRDDVVTRSCGLSSTIAISSSTTSRSESISAKAGS
jgi:hypothetical protein